jgi:hypothetical protein
MKLMRSSATTREQISGACARIAIVSDFAYDTAIPGGLTGPIWQKSVRKQ